MVESIIETTLLVAFSAVLMLIFRTLAHIGRIATGQHRVELTCGCPHTYALFVSQDKPDADYECPICGYTLVAHLQEDGWIKTGAG